MYIMPAKRMHTLIAQTVASDVETDLSLIAKNHEARRNFLLERVDCCVDLQTLQDATCLILSELDINLSPEALNHITKLFPALRINLSEYGVADTETAELLLDAIYSFFVGCHSPDFGDVPEGDRILKEYLHDRAKAAGYEVILCQD